MHTAHCCAFPAPPRTANSNSRSAACSAPCSVRAVHYCARFTFRRLLSHFTLYADGSRVYIYATRLPSAYNLFHISLVGPLPPAARRPRHQLARGMAPGPGRQRPSIGPSSVCVCAGSVKRLCLGGSAGVSLNCPTPHLPLELDQQPPLSSAVSHLISGARPAPPRAAGSSLFCACGKCSEQRERSAGQEVQRVQWESAVSAVRECSE